MEEHDEVLWPWVPVLDLALVAVGIHAQLGRVELLVGEGEAAVAAAARGAAARGHRLLALLLRLAVAWLRKKMANDFITDLRS